MKIIQKIYFSDIFDPQNENKTKVNLINVPLLIIINVVLWIYVSLLIENKYC